MVPDYVNIWTDGSCLVCEKGTPGGWGVVIELPRCTMSGRREILEFSNSVRSVTPLRIEMLAVLNGIRRSIKLGYTEIQVYTDSKNLVNICTNRMYVWQQREWTIEKRPKRIVHNRDLVEQLYDLFTNSNNNITIDWVKAHIGNPLNERANELAKEASKRALELRKINKLENKQENLK